MRILCHPADFARMTNWKNDQAPCTTTMAGSLLGAQSNHHDAEVHPPFSLACAREHQPRPMLAAYRVVLHLPRHGRSGSPTTQDVSFRYGMFLFVHWYFASASHFHLDICEDVQQGAAVAGPLCLF